MNPSSEQINTKSTCLVHDWLVAMRGGEKVLERLVELFPNAPIYTLFVKKRNLSPLLREKKFHVSFLQWIPGIHKFYRWFLPIFPFAIGTLNVRKYDLVISSSHCVAKAARAGKDALHVCYCHTPMRYLWGFEEEYFGNYPIWLRSLIQLCFGFLKKWDIKTSHRVTAFIANSANTAGKIKNLYGREAHIIHPPIEVPNERQCITQPKRDGYFLIVSALVPYKKVDLAIEAFNQLKEPLKIIGDGPLMNSLKKKVRYDEIEFEGWLDQTALWDRYANCRALIFPGEEDFGIVPLEAQMCGKPVIAFGKGGALETVLAFNEENISRRAQESTGIFFYEQNHESLCQAVQKFPTLEFNPAFIKNHALQFSSDQFRRQMVSFLNDCLGRTSSR